MTERGSGCQVVDNAQARAHKMGLDASRVFCSLIHICSGNSCMFNGQDTQEPLLPENPLLPLNVTPKDKFYEKLEARSALTPASYLDNPHP